MTEPGYLSPAYIIRHEAYNAIDSVKAAVKSVCGINPKCKGVRTFVDRMDNPDGYQIHSSETILYFKDGIGVRVTIEIDHMPGG